MPLLSLKGNSSLFVNLFGSKLLDRIINNWSWSSIELGRLNRQPKNSYTMESYEANQHVKKNCLFSQLTNL